MQKPHVGAIVSGIFGVLMTQIKVSWEIIHGDML